MAWCTQQSISAPCCLQHCIYALSMCVAQVGCREAVRRGRRQSYCLDDLVGSNHEATQSVIMGFSSDGRSLVAYSGRSLVALSSACPCAYQSVVVVSNGVIVVVVRAVVIVVVVSMLMLFSSACVDVVLLVLVSTVVMIVAVK